MADLVPKADDDPRGDYLDLAALYASILPAALAGTLMPGLGEAIASVVTGMATDRKIRRAREVIRGVAEDLSGFKSEVSERYVKTEDFEDLLEETLRQVGRERDEAKRQVYRDFLVSIIRRPAESYDAALELLRIIERLSPDHVRVLRAIAEPPPKESRLMTAAPLQVLAGRIRDTPRDRIVELVEALDDLKVTKLAERLHTMMTARGAEDLRSSITPLGHRVIDFQSKAR